MKKINISKFLFYMSYFLLIAYYLCVKVYSFDKVRHYILWIIIGLLLLLFITQSKKYTLKTILLIFICVFCFFISYRRSDNRDLFLTVLFIIVSKNIDINKFIKFDYYIKFLFLIVIVSLYGLGLTEVIIKYRHDGTVRYALGFGHPNVLGALLFSICADLIFLKYKKMKFFDFLVFIISFLICTFVSDSRSAQMGIILLVIMYYVMPLIERRKVVCKLIPYFPVLLLLFSYFAAIMYGNKSDFAIFLDDLTTTRVRCSFEFLDYYGVNLFGHYFEYYGLWDQRSYLTVLDNSYMNMLIQYGIIPVTIVIISFFLSLKNALKTSNYNIIICFVCLLSYGLMENYSYMIAYSSILIYLSCIIYEKQVNKNKKENENEK